MAKKVSAEEAIKMVSSLDSSMGYTITPIEETDDTKEGNGLRIVRVNIIDPESGEAVEEVDVYTCADAVIFKNNRSLPQELEYTMQYTNSNETPDDFGGIPQGTNFVNKPIKELLTDLLYPYVQPELTLTSSVAGRYYEKGENAAPITISLTVKKKTEDIVSANLIMNGVAVGQFRDINPEGGTFAFSYSNALTENTTFVARVTDATGRAYDSNEHKIPFNNPIYIGTVSHAEKITQDMIKGCIKRLDFDDKNNISMAESLNPNEQSFLIAYESYPNNTEKVMIRDDNGFNITKSFDKSYITMELANDEEVQYVCLRSNMTTQKDFKLYIDIKY